MSCHDEIISVIKLTYMKQGRLWKTSNSGSWGLQDLIHSLLLYGFGMWHHWRLMSRFYSLDIRTQFALMPLLLLFSSRNGFDGFKDDIGYNPSCMQIPPGYYWRRELVHVIPRLICYLMLSLIWWGAELMFLFTTYWIICMTVILQGVSYRYNHGVTNLKW